MTRPLPSGKCHFQNPNLKTSDYNTSCQCQTFWLDAPAEASLSTTASDDRELVLHKGSAQKPVKDGAKESRQSTPAPRYGFCVCGHHACFHDASSIELKYSKHNQSTLETEKERTVNSFQTAKQSPSKATSYRADHLHHSSTTVDDNAPIYATNVRDEHDTGNRGDWARTSLNSDGLGLSIITTRDEPSNINNATTGSRHQVASEQSSSTTEVMPHVYFPNGYHHHHHHNLQMDTFREEASRNALYSSVPIFQSPRLRPHPQIQRLTPRIQQYGSDRSSSTVADPPYYTHPGLLSISRQAIGVVNALSTISTTLLPSHLQNRQITELNSSATSADRMPQPVSNLEDHPYFADEVTRKAMAAEEAARDLLQCIEQSTSQFSETLVEEPHVSQLVQIKHQSTADNQSTSVYPMVHSPSERLSSPDSLRSVESKQSVFSAIPPPLVAPARETGIHNTLQNQLKTLVERLEGMEDTLEDTANKAELAEDRVVEMENRVINVEDKVDNVAESFSKHKDESLLRKRMRDEQDDDGDSQDYYVGKGSSAKKKRKKRRKHNLMAEDTSALPVLSRDQNTLVQHAHPETTIKQTTTTTRTSVTSTSFTSVSSHGSSASTRHKTHSLLSSVLLQLDSLSTRIAALEFVSAPTPAKPWTVQIVVLPPSTWSTWKKKENVYSLNNSVPKAPIVGSKAWKRLESRGLIKTVDVTGGEARDFERVVRKNFGSIFKTLNAGMSDEGLTGSPWEWSPLRKIPKQATLRYLNIGEMDKGFWKVDFIRGTCSTPLTTSVSSAATSVMPSSDPLTPTKLIEAERQEPTHRLWITNCWTGCLSNSSEDITRESTQVSSVDQSSSNRKQIGSVTSTQKSISSLVRDKKKLNASQVDDDSSYTRPIMTNPALLNRSGGGWDEIKSLDRAKPLIHPNPLGNDGNPKSKPSDSLSDIWQHDIVLDGPLSELTSLTSLARTSGDTAEPSQPTHQLISKTNDAFSDSDAPSSRPSLIKTWSAGGIPESLDKGSAGCRHVESFASQASFYGFENSSVRGEDVLANDNDEEPSHTLRPSTISHDSAPTPRASAATPVPPFHSHPKQLKRRLEDLQEYLAENPSLDSSLLRYNSPYEYDEERHRESRSPTVEDDPPASLVSHQAGSNHGSTGPTLMPGAQHNLATNRRRSPHYSGRNVILDKAASFDVSRRLTRSSSALGVPLGKSKMRSQD